MRQVTRRRFVESICFAGGALALSASHPRMRQAAQPSLAGAAGIQLYTVGKECTADLPGTLGALATMGYRSVESAGFFDKTAQEFRAALDNAGLKCPSSHLFLKQDRSDLAEVLEKVQVLGSEYVVSSFVFAEATTFKSMEEYFKRAAARTADDFKKSAHVINEMAAKAKQAGLKFAYHNHNTEFRAFENGKTGYAILMAETDPSLVKLELDCGWSDLGGHPPLKLFTRYPGRFRMLHIKDFLPLPQPIVRDDQRAEITWTELGQGHMDYRSILAAAPKAGVEHIFVEQEPPYTKFTAMEAAKANLQYLHSIA